MTRSHPPVLVIGGGVVGAAVLLTLAHRGVPAVLLEADTGLAYSASGTNSGVLHTGFDSAPGHLETALILRSARIRPAVLQRLEVPVLHCGAALQPRSPAERDVVTELYRNARSNGIEVALRESDGALLVPDESVTDPVAFTRAMAASAETAGARVELNARVVGIDRHTDSLTAHLADGRAVRGAAAINCAGLHADDVARLVGDRSFQIYPRKGEFFVFELPDGAQLDHIILPVPSARTKGVLVFPTLDGKVVAGPTAVDEVDKDDWRVRPEAAGEILTKAVQQFPALDGLDPIDSYAGLRPAGRGCNYVIRPSTTYPRLLNVAAIRSTGLTAALGIAEHVVGFLPHLDIDLAPPTELVTGPPVEPSDQPWWQRTSQRFRTGARAGAGQAGDS
ncbi:glycerol-3-phosphate dehydrogenase [Quadrisphaera granulorum]|uniref:Glycerol-3-phosphate dehydrogenase n=1 Tax=Quadrisphaera granulorum TaxID=317664 RepID=A0A315ZVJ8_9ACTN|nr:FAD-dependent oxidoreductase [Quadrisphaera granulorum]PWJ49535.1 glycerol-3-phosphate dehydrogenase [Quadrisphaera granulorum]SZE98114.1 glycerol-3-phosphate dehydrogenase [Quadrisphaera granulorum]